MSIKIEIIAASTEDLEKILRKLSKLVPDVTPVPQLAGRDLLGELHGNRLRAEAEAEAEAVAVRSLPVAAQTGDMLVNDAGHADPEGYEPDLTQGLADAAPETSGSEVAAKPKPRGKSKAAAKVDTPAAAKVDTPAEAPAPATDLPKVPDDAEVERLEGVRAKAITILTDVYTRTKQNGNGRVKELLQKFGVSQFAKVPLELVEELHADAVRLEAETKIN